MSRGRFTSRAGHILSWVSFVTHAVLILISETGTYTVFLTHLYSGEDQFTDLTENTPLLS